MRRRERVHALELLHRRADAQRAADLGGAHVREDRRQLLVQLGEGQVAVGIDVHASGAVRVGGVGARERTRPPARAARRMPRQMVCVGFDEEIDVPSTSSMRIFSRRVFSSCGKRTPTPCVRPPGALAGVIQPTLPATG